MTNKDLCEFLLARANDKGREFGVKNAQLVVHKNGKNLYLAIKSDGFVLPFLIRFTQRFNAVFKLTSIDPSFSSFYANACSMMASKHTNEIPYDDAKLPNVLKNKVSAALVQAFKTNGMGLDLINPSIGKSIQIVQPNETYEEIAIENDLNSFMSCDIFAL